MSYDKFVIDHETLVQLAEACKAHRKLFGPDSFWYSIQDMSCVNAEGRQWYLCILDVNETNTIESWYSEYAGPWASAEDCYYAATKAEWLVAQDSDTVEHLS
jgi:hypothetical protein